MWSGTANSFVNLNPSGASSSEAKSTSGSQQVGFVNFSAGFTVYNAALWSGTANSFVNLNPLGSTYSVASGVSGSQQVGEASVNGQIVASLWSGTADSFVNLQSVLGSDYTSSQAVDIYISGNTTYVVGSANTLAGYGHAVLWTITDMSSVPEPSTTLILLVFVPIFIYVIRQRLWTNRITSFKC